MTMRTTQCEGCGGAFEIGPTGRPPKRCPKCKEGAPVGPKTAPEQPVQPDRRLLVPVLDDVLASMRLQPQDAVAVALARRLAFLLDSGNHYGMHEPTSVAAYKQFLEVLTALGMTPAARNKVTEGGATGDGGSVSPLADYRRRYGLRAAQAVDEASS